MKEYVYKSLALHVLVFIIIMIDLPLFFLSRKTHMSQVPIVVDLKDVKISEMTNLPPKAEFGKEDKQASTTKRKDEKVYAKEEKVEKTPEVPETPVKEEVKEQPKEQEAAAEAPKKDFLVAPQPKKPQKAEPKKALPAPPKKPQPKKPDAKTAKKAEPGSPELANPLKSLLASVDDIERRLGSSDSKATIKEGTQVSNMGIEGGIGGSYFSELSISEIDAISGRLRACWNVDPGARGIENMIIEVRAFLNQDGSVKDVRILDTSRYNNDTHFRSVADSARRAVYVCAPYSIFSEKYPDKYDKWKTMLIRFNPLDGSVN